MTSPRSFEDLVAVPGFTVEAYVDRVRALHERIEAEGAFVAYSSRHLVGARKKRPAPGREPFGARRRWAPFS